MTPRITPVTGDDLEAIQAAQGSLGVPHLFREDGVDGSYWADADELRAWRSHFTSTAEPK